jgi:hypothetical protein
MKKLMITLLLVAWPLMSYGSCDTKGCNTLIKRLYATGLADGRVLLQPEDDPKGIVNCSLVENTFFSLKKSHPSFNEIYAMALASTLANRPVRMRIKEGTSDCELSYMWVWN